MVASPPFSRSNKFSSLSLSLQDRCSSPSLGGPPLSLAQFVNNLVAGLRWGDDTRGHSMWSRRALTSAKQKRIITFFRATGCCCLCWLWSNCCLPTSPQPLQQSCHPDRQLPAKMCAGCPPSPQAGCLSLLNFKKLHAGLFLEPAQVLLDRSPALKLVNCTPSVGSRANMATADPAISSSSLRKMLNTTGYCPPGKARPIKLQLSEPNHKMSFLPI